MQITVLTVQNNEQFLTEYEDATQFRNFYSIRPILLRRQSQAE